MLYFAVHFSVEITSFYVLTSYTDSVYVWWLMLIYDFVAFVPQGFFGFLRDKNIKINFALIGTALTTLSLVLMWLDLNVFLIIVVISLGNCLIHVHGAELTLRSSPGKMTPSAVFVAGGSFGLVVGKLMAMHHIPIIFVLIINLLSLAPIMLAELFKDDDGYDNLKKYRFASNRFSPAVIIALATFVVAVRAFMGYGIPTAWNKTELQTILLFFAMGIGKGLGGVLTDKIGIRLTAMISTIGALPFLIAGENLMLISLLGISIFSMTMAVTLALIVSVLQKYPGVAFGFTTLGLFLGTSLMFFFRIHSFIVNAILISVLTVLCMLILGMICSKRDKEKIL